MHVHRAPGMLWARGTEGRVRQSGVEAQGAGFALGAPHLGAELSRIALLAVRGADGSVLECTRARARKLSRARAPHAARRILARARISARLQNAPACVRAYL